MFSAKRRTQHDFEQVPDQDQGQDQGQGQGQGRYQDAGSVRLRKRSVMHRYFFYGWMFRDASRGNFWERAAALAHNRQQSRWLPTYLARWIAITAVLMAMGGFCEVVLSSHFLSVPFYLLMTVAVAYNMVTAACWSLLRTGA
jgi:hypothetical protein